MTGVDRSLGLQDTLSEESYKDSTLVSVSLEFCGQSAA